MSRERRSIVLSRHVVAGAAALLVCLSACSDGTPPDSAPPSEPPHPELDTTTSDGSTDVTSDDELTGSSEPSPGEVAADPDAPVCGLVDDYMAAGDQFFELLDSPDATTMDFAAAFPMIRATLDEVADVVPSGVEACAVAAADWFAELDDIWSAAGYDPDVADRAAALASAQTDELGAAFQELDAFIAGTCWTEDTGDIPQPPEPSYVEGPDGELTWDRDALAEMMMFYNGLDRADAECVADTWLASDPPAPDAPVEEADAFMAAVYDACHIAIPAPPLP